MEPQPCSPTDSSSNRERRDVHESAAVSSAVDNRCAGVSLYSREAPILVPASSRVGERPIPALAKPLVPSWLGGFCAFQYLFRQRTREGETMTTMPFEKYRPYPAVELHDRTWPDDRTRDGTDLVLGRSSGRQPGARRPDGHAPASAACGTDSWRLASRRSRSASRPPPRLISTSSVN